MPLADETLQILIISGKIPEKQQQGIVDIDAVDDDRGNVLTTKQPQVVQELLQVFKGQEIYVVQPVYRKPEVDVGFIGSYDLGKTAVLADAVVDDAEYHIVVHAVDCGEQTRSAP